MPRIQQGRALVVFIIVGAFAAAGVLGFVLWSKHAAPIDGTSQDTASSQQKSATSPANLLYESERYTFEYPRDGWRLVEEHYDPNNKSQVTPVLRTSDWAQSGIAAEKGAAVSVNVSTASKTLLVLKEEAANFADGTARDFKDMKVDGVDAFSYKLSYEGERYNTVFIHDGREYYVQYEHAYGVEPSVHIGGYDTIVSTFRFK